MSDRGRALAALGVLAVITTALLSPVVLQGRFFEWDVGEQYWPDLVYLCESLHDGEIPYWNPYDRAGYPSYADPQAGTWHPLNWAICAVAGPAPGPMWAVARVVLGFFLAGAFGLLWLRRLELDWGPALLGATVIECAPFLRHNWELNLTSAFAWTGLMLWAAEGVATKRRPRDAAALALATAACVWVGSPPGAWMAGTFVAAYLVARALAQPRGERWAVARGAGFAAALTVPLVAVVLVPAANLASHSVQAGRDLASIAAGALQPHDLVALVWPQPGNHLYVGLGTLVLAALALKAGKLPARGFFAGAAVVAVVMSLGLATPLFGLAFEAIPGVRVFRLPHRYEAWLGPAMGALAAGGLTVVAERWKVAGSLGVAALLCLVTFADVSRALPPDRHTRDGEHPGLDDSALLRAPSAWRYLDEFAVGCRSGTRHRRRDLRGYQDPLQLRAYERVIGSLRDYPRMAEQLSVRYALTGPHFIHGWNRHFLPPPDQLLRIEGARDIGGGVIELPAPNPSAWFVPAAQVGRAAHRSDALSRVLRIAPALVAVVEPDADTDALAPPPTPELEIVLDPAAGIPARSFELSPDRVTVTFDAPTAGVVVVNEAWYPGWTATVDGAPAEVFRTNGFVRGVGVPAGASRLELSFRPADGAPLRWLLLLGWVAVLGLIGWPKFQARSPAEVP